MSEKIIRVWDPLVRVFHWSLVVVFIVAWFSGEEESLVHVYAGYVILGLLVFRIVWGLVGPRYSRFSNFLYSPGRTVRYMRSLLSPNPEHYTGHNPAGGWMIMLLLVSLLLSVYTGLEVYGAEGQGPLAAGSPDVEWIATARADSDDEHDGDHDNDAEEFWEELHEFFANFTLFLVFVHVAGVLVASYVHRENLVRAMITGRKRASEE
ncbi:MAG TPA: cytochrome b/b6 domain-containing protein [Gammaproteobacteria bacterium]|jgi:cytochrome b|nr:cytochrome b/b6 domain-containing protein [Gammaproteobacteria bacterium]